MAIADFNTGDKVSERYEIREILGHGTFGPAYKVQDHTRNRAAVLKALPGPFRKKEAIAKAFIRYYRGRIGDEAPGLAAIYDVAIHEGIPYVVMEFVEGLSLARLIEARVDEGKPFEFEEAESILEEVGQPLNALHQKSFHGGLKPQNVFLMPDRVKIADEGVLEILGAELFARIQIKSPEAAPYLAPEMLSEPDKVSREADLFALAALGYALLSGEAPDMPPADLGAMRDDLPAGVHAVLARGMAEDPAKRFPSVNTFLLDLARVGGDEQKIRVLESVVQSEASEAAERAVAQMRDAEEAAQPAEEAEGSGQEEIAPGPDDEVASQLFEDEDLHEPTEEEAEEADEDSAASGTPSESATAEAREQPAPAQAGGGGAGRWVAGILFLLLAGGGVAYGLAWQGFIEIPGLPLPGQKAEVDPRLRAAVEKVVATTDGLRVKIKETGADDITESDPYVTAVSHVDSARESLDEGDPAMALEEAQRAESIFSELLDDLEEQARKARAEREQAERAAVERRRSAEQEARDREQKARRTQQAAAPTPAEPEGCPDGMVEVPSGPFMIGSPPDDLLRDATERELSRVTVSAFCIDRYEFPNRKGARPKTNVSRSEARKLCGQEGKRLCRESEWEKACKGPKGTDFPYGQAWDPNRCNTETATGEDRSLAPAGQFDRCLSDYGVADLSGNVMEWTEASFEQNRELAIAKGGSAMRPDYAARCAYRYTAPPRTKDPELGFRCCTDL